MINAAELAENLRDKLRDVTALVSELGGSPESIFCFHDKYPDSVSLTQAIHDMPAPGLMICWTGRSLGSFGQADVFKHQFSVFMRSGEGVDTEPPSSYYRIDQLLWKGIPDGETLPMRYLTIHASCYPMDPYGISRQSDQEGVDYFEAQLTFGEKGDD